MRRRDFLMVAGGAMLACALVSTSTVADTRQIGKIPRVGVMGALGNASTLRLGVQPFLASLRDLGYEEGRNVAIEVRSAEGHLERLPSVAADLVGLKVDVVVVLVCGAPLNAAMQATKTIPIVVAACNDDMIETGIIANLAHPGGNVTGLNKMTAELTAKRLDLLKEMVPNAANVAVLWDPGYSASTADWQALRARAGIKGVRLQPVEAHVPADLDKAFTRMVRERVDAVLSFSDAMTYNHPGQMAELASSNKLPMITPFREITNAGGLMSYGPNIPDMFRHAAVYVDKILKGANPADLPVEQPTKFEMLINLKTAKTLGIEVPPTLLARADEVIE